MTDELKTAKTVYDVVECEERKGPYGMMLRIMVSRRDLKPMYYREVWEVAQKYYPRRWWLQSGPWPELLLDNVNKYHLWLLAEGVRPLDFDLMGEIEV